MFIQSFPFRFINSQQNNDGIKPCIRYTYDFRGKNGSRYIVVIEQYEMNLCAAKFYSAQYKYCHHKYNRLTENNEGGRVLTTVGMIMMDHFKRNPFASFFFVGSTLYLKNEAKPNNKRFRLYARVAESVIAPAHFEHLSLPEFSAYTMINHNNSHPDILERLEENLKYYIENCLL